MCLQILYKYTAQRCSVERLDKENVCFHVAAQIPAIILIATPSNGSMNAKTVPWTHVKKKVMVFVLPFLRCTYNQGANLIYITNLEILMYTDTGEEISVLKEGSRYIALIYYFWHDMLYVQRERPKYTHKNKGSAPMPPI